MNSLTIGLEAGIVEVSETKLLAGIFSLENGLCIACANIAAVAISKSKCQRLYVRALKQECDEVTNANGDFLAVNSGLHGPSINRVEHTENHDMCIRIDLSDSLEYLIVVVMIADIAVNQTLCQSTKKLSRILDFDICGKILFKKTHRINEGNDQIKHLFKVCHFSATLFDTYSAPIKLVGIALGSAHNAVNVLTCEGKEVTTTDSNGDKV